MTRQPSGYFLELQENLYTYAAWPVPPRSWSSALLALASGSGSGDKDTLGRILAPILNKAGYQGDRNLRAVISLSADSHPEILQAVTSDSVTLHLTDEGRQTRSKIIADRTGREMESLLGPQDDRPVWQPGPDFPDLEAFSSLLEKGCHLLVKRLTSLNSKISNEKIVIQGIVTLKYLLEALFFLKTSRIPKYGRFDQILEDQCAVLLLDAPEPTGDFDILLKQVGLRRSEFARAFTRLRDRIRSGESFDYMIYKPRDTAAMAARLRSVRNTRRPL
ncbi:MAG: hypothetical protein LAT81_14425 [Oceanicaulis sp.]|nr:hypothetical protein [Oceanicaulis sp.]